MITVFMDYEDIKYNYISYIETNTDYFIDEDREMLFDLYLDDEIMNTHCLVNRRTGTTFSSILYLLCDIRFNELTTNIYVVGKEFEANDLYKTIIESDMFNEPNDISRNFTYMGDMKREIRMGDSILTIVPYSMINQLNQTLRGRRGRIGVYFDNSCINIEQQVIDNIYYSCAPLPNFKLKICHTN